MREMIIDKADERFLDNPRGWTNMTTMLCYHKRYDFGDKSDKKPNSTDYSGWGNLEKAIRKAYKVKFIMPIYMYDHGGVRLSTKPFNDPWDSGRLGFIFITEDRWKEFASHLELPSLEGPVTAEMKLKAERIMNQEVDMYDSYLNGDVLSLRIVDTETKEVIYEDSNHYPVEDDIGKAKQEEIYSNLMKGSEISEFSRLVGINGHPEYGVEQSYLISVLKRYFAWDHIESLARGNYIRRIKLGSTLT